MATKIQKAEQKIHLMNEDDRIKNLATLNYIRQLASMTNVNINDWNVLSIFGDNVGNLIADKKEINKLFFENHNKAKEKVNESSDQEPNKTDIEIPNLLDTLKRTYKTDKEAKLQQSERRINDLESNARDYHQRLEIVLQEINKQSVIIEGLQGKSDDLIFQKIEDQVKSVVRKGFWINPVIDGDCLYLNTSGNIVLTLNNPAAKLNMSLDFGQFFTQIQLRNLSLKVFPYKNNIRHNLRNGHYHPHLSNEGYVCWGNALDTVTKKTKSIDLEGVMELLAAVLTQYNDQAPYVSLANFVSNHKKLISRSGFQHPEKRAIKETTVVDGNTSITVDQNGHPISVVDTTPF